MMLVVQTAEDMLYVPGREVATIMPTYPERWRVVLCDGRVGHRHGDLPTGPWARLGRGWANSTWLRRQGEEWVDPADFHYPYEPLADPPEDEHESECVPEGLLVVEKRGKNWVWRTDSEELPCDLSTKQLREVIPNLIEVKVSQFLYLPRLRRFGAGGGGGWLELDQGERLTVSSCSSAPRVAARLGLDSLTTQDSSVPWKLWRLREFPYDLASGEALRIRADLPDAKQFAEQFLWQAVVRTEGGQDGPGADDSVSFYDRLASAAERVGYSFSRSDWQALRQELVLQQGVIRLRQLGFRELDGSARYLGQNRPQVVLLAPFAHRQAARRAAEQAGISMLAPSREFHLPLEYLASELQGAIQLLIWKRKARDVVNIRERFALLGRPTFGHPVAVPDLEQLEAVVAGLPTHAATGSVEPLRRVPLEDFEGLYFAEPEEILSWAPTRPDRWRVELQGGRVLHHPGPPPGLHNPPTAQPDDPRLPCRAQQVLFLEERDDSGVWHLEDGNEVCSGVTFSEAAAQHRGLLPISRRFSLNYNRIRSSYSTGAPTLCMDSGHEFRIPLNYYGRQLKERMGLSSLSELGPDSQGLRKFEIRDVPYEIARASGERLRSDFAGPIALIANVIWQVYCGLYTYNRTFSGFFYMPLQAILYRAGYLTRAQVRAAWRSDAAKDRLYKTFCNTVTEMVRECRLFTYRELGFRDEFPDHRLLGDRQPQRILLVEKGDRLGEHARRLQQETGMTLMLLQGMPSLLACEYFVLALRQIYTGPVEIYFYGDFDEAGWDIGPAFIKQLRFYGIECIRLERLVLPLVFSPEEQALYSRPLVPTSPREKGRLERFVRESGGVQGQARGIHANWLQPFERVQARLYQLLQ